MRGTRFVSSVLGIAIWLTSQGAAEAQIIDTVAGGGPDNIHALSANLNEPLGVAVDSVGNLFISAVGSYRIFKVDAFGQLTIEAGNGSGFYSGDGGPATSAGLTGPHGIALDADGNLFIADESPRRVDAATGIITSVASIGTFFGTNPSAIVPDAEGNLFIAQWGDSRVRRVDATTGTITTVAGIGLRYFGGDGGLAKNAALNRPTGVALDEVGNLFIADSGNNRIRRVDAATGIITTVAGGGGGGDGGPATSARLDSPYGVALDASGNIFIADRDDDRIRRVDAATGIITTVAGSNRGGYRGDGGPATNASLSSPHGVASDSDDNLFIADRGNGRIRRVDRATGIVTTIARIRNSSSPTGVSLDAVGNLFFSDHSPNRIRRVDLATGIITNVAGNGSHDFCGDGGPATSACLAVPSGIAVDAAGNLFIADSSNDRIRHVNAATGIITTIAGTGANSYGGDGGPATSAWLNRPIDVALDEAGNLFIADQTNLRIRRVDAATGIITTVAGNGSRGFSGDGGPATSATLNNPHAVALDAEGNLFIADSWNDSIRRVDAATGIITTVAGNGSRGFSGDGESATNAQLSSPKGVAVSADGTLVIADTGNERIRQVGTAVIDIDIDVKPGSTPNSINPTNKGVVPVAVLASGTFDVSEVDGATLVFGKNETSPSHDLDDSVTFADHLEDVNGDGLMDLVSHYLAEESGITFGDLSVCISGKTLSGTPLRGCDAIRTVPDIDGDGLLDIQEVSIGTNVFFADSDGDGYDDGQEVFLLETDPLDPLDPTPVRKRRGRGGKRRR